MTAQGVVRAEEGNVLGVVPTHRWPTTDVQHEPEVRTLITQALVEQTTPDNRTAALIALIHALKREHNIVKPRQHKSVTPNRCERDVTDAELAPQCAR